MDSRIRVETWDRKFVKINTTYLVQQPYQLEVKDNMILFDKKRHLELNPDDLNNGNIMGAILNEVFFMIYIPEDVIVNNNSIKGD